MGQEKELSQQLSKQFITLLDNFNSFMGNINGMMAQANAKLTPTCANGAKTEKPAKKPRKKKPAKDVEHSAPAPEESSHVEAESSIDAVRAVMVRMVQHDSYGEAFVTKMLEARGVDKLSKLPSSQYTSFIEDMTEFLEEG